MNATDVVALCLTAHMLLENEDLSFQFTPQSLGMWSVGLRGRQKYELIYVANPRFAWYSAELGRALLNQVYFHARWLEARMSQVWHLERREQRIAKR